MNLFGVMEVSGSALKAERIRAEVVAANMANAETTRTADGTPYKRQHVVFAAAREPGWTELGRSNWSERNRGNFQSQLLSAAGRHFPHRPGAAGRGRGYRSGRRPGTGGAPLRSPASRRR